MKSEAHRRHARLRRAAGLVWIAVWSATATTSAQELDAWPDELSGIARLSSGRLLLVDDEEKHRAFVVAPTDALSGELPDVAPLPLRMDDLEGACVTADGSVILMTSHSLTKKGKLKPARRLLVRLSSAWPDQPAPRSDVVEDLFPILQEAYAHAQRGAELVDPEPARPQVATANATLNLEGVACYPAGSALFFGARSPLDDEEKAIVFEVGTIDALFAGEPVRTRLHRLELDGRGIRGLARDPYRDAILVLAGPAAGENGSFAVYAWTPSSGTLLALEAEGLDQLPQPEGVLAGGAVDEAGVGPIILVTENAPRHRSPLVELVARPAP